MTDRGRSGRGRQRHLSQEELRRLFDRCRRGSAAARQALVAAHLDVLSRIARRYCGLGLSHDDLINEGTLGLIEAVSRFDPDRNIQFITYAAWWARKAMMRALSEHAHMVQLPLRFSRKIGEMNDAQQELRRRLGREPTRQELAERLGVAIADLERLQLLLERDVSLAQPVSRDRGDQSIEDRLVDPSVGAEELVVLRDRMSRLVRSLPDLSPRQRRVLTLRFGLGGGQAKSLRWIADQFGVSRERVRQIELAALRQLRASVRRRVPGIARTKRPYPPVRSRPPRADGDS